MAHDRLRLERLRPDQYRQVAEWDWGDRLEDADWPRYTLEMSAPNWSHYAVYSGVDFVGCISFEDDHGTIAVHVTTARRKIHPNNLAQVLLKKAKEYFDSGHNALVARIPIDKRAAARLAIRCGMHEWGHTPQLRFFILTRKSFYGSWQTSSR